MIYFLQALINTTHAENIRSVSIRSTVNSMLTATTFFPPQFDPCSSKFSEFEWIFHQRALRQCKSKTG